MGLKFWKDDDTVERVQVQGESAGIEQIVCPPVLNLVYGGSTNSSGAVASATGR